PRERRHATMLTLIKNSALVYDYWVSKQNTRYIPRQATIKFSELWRPRQIFPYQLPHDGLRGDNHHCISRRLVSLKCIPDCTSADLIPSFSLHVRLRPHRQQLPPRVNAVL